jgi:hypothetical protein
VKAAGHQHRRRHLGRAVRRFLYPQGHHPRPGRPSAGTAGFLARAGGRPRCRKPKLRADRGRRPPAQLMSGPDPREHLHHQLRDRLSRAGEVGLTPRSVIRYGSQPRLRARSDLGPGSSPGPDSRPARRLRAWPAPGTRFGSGRRSCSGHRFGSGHRSCSGDRFGSAHRFGSGHGPGPGIEPPRGGDRAQRALGPGWTCRRRVAGGECE